MEQVEPGHHDAWVRKLFSLGRDVECAEGKLSEMRLERRTALCSRELWVPEVLGLYSVGSL